MRVILEIIEGQKKGLKLEFTEPECFLVGRDAPGSHAHLRLPPDDKYVSRNHFMLEIKPPKCYIMDYGSKNGTWLKKVSQSQFHRIQFSELQNGDQLKVGNTVLKIKISEDIHEEDEKEDFQVDTFKLDKRKSFIQAVCTNCGTTLQVDDETEIIKKLEISYCCKSCSEELKSSVLPDRKPTFSNIDSYELIKILGIGGMGIVYLARDTNTGRMCVIKQIKENITSEKILKRFKREMLIMERLFHLNIVYLIDSGVYENKPYFVLEYCPDGDLNHYFINYLKKYKKPLPIKEACSFILQALNGLEYAHSKNIVHRDIKPQNLLLKQARDVVTEGIETNFIVKISDFGISKCYDDLGISTITKTGEAAGTRFYIAPEQIKNFKYVGPSADLYSIGVTLYLLLTGKYQFDFPDPLEQLNGLLRRKPPKDPILMVLEDDPIPVKYRNPDIPKQLAEVVDKSVKREPSERFQTAREFKEAILDVMKKKLKKLEFNKVVICCKIL